MTKVTAVIVARGGSKRLQRKNLLIIAGKTLVGHKISQLQECNAIDHIIVGSENDEILAEAKRYGVEAVRRPEFFCDDTRATANEMIGNMCSLIHAEIILWAHCTNPLVTAPTYADAIRAFFFEAKHGYDSLLSVAEVRGHLWSADRKPMNYNPYTPRHIVAAELEPLYQQDGAIFIQPYEQMAQNHYYFGKNPYLFVMPEEEVLDIDTPHDFDVAKAYVEFKQRTAHV